MRLIFILLLSLIWCGKKPAQNNLDVTSAKPKPIIINDQRPNILWIVADDLGPDLNCYGETLVYTPNLDRLASEGVKYANAYTVAAVCSVSRSTLITGMYPCSIHCQQHRTRFKDPLPKPVKPITSYFRQAGYFVTNKGKTDYNFIHDKKSLFDGTDWGKRKEGQPFFSQIQIHLPHRPFLRDASHPIDPDKIKLPPYYPDHPIARQDWAMYLETVQLMDQKVGEILDRLEKDGLSENTVVFFFGDQGRPNVRAKQFLYDAGLHTPLIVRWPGKLRSGTTNSDLIGNIDIAPTSMNIANIDLEDYIQGQDFLNDKTTPRKNVFAMRDRREEKVDRNRMVRSGDFKYIKNYYPELPYTQFNAYKKYSYPVLTLMQVMFKDGKLSDEQASFMKKNRPHEELYDLQNDPYEIYNLCLLYTSDAA